MTYILHLETATKACSVALSANGVLKQEKEFTGEGYSHGENLTLFIEELMQREGISYSDLSALSLSSGPGSYTGLRIGVSTAKGLCYACALPLIAIDSLTCIYLAAKEKHPDRTIIPMIDARRMEVFSAVFAPSGDLLKPISADVIAENTYLEFGNVVACGDGAEKLKSIWENRTLSIDSSILSTAKAQCKAAYDLYLKNHFEDLAYFEPFYLKDFASH